LGRAEPVNVDNRALFGLVNDRGWTTGVVVHIIAALVPRNLQLQRAVMNRCDYRSSARAGRNLRWFVVPAVTIVVIVAAGTSGVARQGRRTVWDGIYNEEQALRGKQLYGGNCSVCHGTGLEGGDEAPMLKGDSFIFRWTDSSIDDMVTAISTSMPANAPGSLAAQQYVDIAMYLLSENKFPVGKEEIKADAALLKAIAITKQGTAR
jgi:hypothetical protein